MKEIEKHFDFFSIDPISEFLDNIGLDDIEYQKALFFYAEDLIKYNNSKVCCYGN